MAALRYLPIVGLFVGVAFFTGCSRFSISKIIAEANVPSVRLVPSDGTFVSFSDCLETHAGLFPYIVNPDFNGLPSVRLEYEIRDATRPVRLARLHFVDRRFLSKTSDEVAEFPKFHHPGFPPTNTQRLLTGVGPGDYRIALLINGVRASNVVSFRIDPTYDYKSQPTVRLAKIEAPPHSSHGTLAAWIVGPPAGQWLKHSDVVGGALLRDGIKSFSPHHIFAANPSFHPGERRAEILEVERYQPQPALSGPHTYELQAGSYPVAPLHCDLATTPLGDAWDHESVIDAPPSPTVLSGSVRDHRGLPLPRAEVLVYNDRVTYIELVDENGHYAFTHLPSGTYTADCYRLDIPQSGRHPYFPPIVIDSSRLNSRDFTFPNDTDP